MSEPTGGMDRPAIIVSCDSHVGPKLVEQLRPYCPQNYLEAFDEDVAAQAEQAGAMTAMSARMSHPNLTRPGTTTRRRAWPTWTATAWPPS